MADRVVILAAQRKNARDLFGDSTVAMAGRASLTEPNLDPAFARLLLDYWIADSRAVFDGMTVLQQIDTTAITRPFIDNIGTMKALRGRLGSLFVPDALIGDIWRSASQAAITGFAVESTPKPWTLVKEAVSEAVAELPSTLAHLPIIEDLLKGAAILMGAILLIEVTK